MGTPLQDAERDMLSMAFKNSLDSRRGAVRSLTETINGEGLHRQPKYAEYAMDYKGKLFSELTGLCDRSLTVIDKLIPTAERGEVLTFYYKMKADYSRYKAEFA